MIDGGALVATEIKPMGSNEAKTLCWPASLLAMNSQSQHLKERFECACDGIFSLSESLAMQHMLERLDGQIEEERARTQAIERSNKQRKDEVIDERVRTAAEKLNAFIGDVCHHFGLLQKNMTNALKRLGLSDDTLEALEW